MGLENPTGVKMLLLDLDCVTIYGGNPRDGLDSKIRLLHPDLSNEISKLALPVVMLTHRSKQDADYIRDKLAALNINIQDLVSSRELFLSALWRFKFAELIKTGLSKSYALDWLERRHAVGRDQMVLIDDRRENLQELINAGAQKGILAPFVDKSDDKDTPALVSFKFGQLQELLSEPLSNRECILEPTAEMKPLDSLPIIGEIDGAQVSLFERLRQGVKSIREKAQRLRSR